MSKFCMTMTTTTITMPRISQYLKFSSKTAELKISIYKASNDTSIWHNSLLSYKDIGWFKSKAFEDDKLNVALTLSQMTNFRLFQTERVCR